MISEEILKPSVLCFKKLAAEGPWGRCQHGSDKNYCVYKNLGKSAFAQGSRSQAGISSANPRPVTLEMSYVLTEACHEPKATVIVFGDQGNCPGASLIQSRAVTLHMREHHQPQTAALAWLDWVPNQGLCIHTGCFQSPMRGVRSRLKQRFPESALLSTGRKCKSPQVPSSS